MAAVCVIKANFHFWLSVAAFSDFGFGWKIESVDIIVWP